MVLFKPRLTSVAGPGRAGRLDRRPTGRLAEQVDGQFQQAGQKQDMAAGRSPSRRYSRTWRSRTWFLRRMGAGVSCLSAPLR